MVGRRLAIVFAIHSLDGFLSHGIFYRLRISIALAIHSLDLSAQLILFSRLRDLLSRSLSIRLRDLLSRSLSIRLIPSYKCATIRDTRQTNVNRTWQPGLFYGHQRTLELSRFNR